jgi:hypothetical protein
MAPKPAVQAAVTVLLLSAAYLAAKCPCRKLLSCHLEWFAVLVGAAVFVVAYDNKNMLINYKTF